MKKLLLIVACVVVSVAIFLSCSKTNDKANENLHHNFVTNSSVNYPLFLGSAVQGQTEIVLINSSDYIDSIVSEGIFDNVDEISIKYGQVVDDSGNINKGGYFTAIGKKNGQSVSYQVPLTFDNSGKLFIENPTMVPLATHSCIGDGCSSCSFSRGGFLGIKITGCVCNGTSGTCNHSVTSGGVRLIELLAIFL